MKETTFMKNLSHRLVGRLRAIVPGLLLCTAITLAAMGAEKLENAVLGGRWLESLVLAIIFGTALCSLVSLPAIFKPGIDFCAKFLLEVAIVLLGASISMSALEHAGLALVGGIAVVVVLALGFSYSLGRLFKLSPKLAVLVACGNSICGNSAIAAAAPVIGAAAEDVAASIAFTAALGVLVVLVLPLLVPLLHQSPTQYGVMAGLTVYAVPQVLAATAPIGNVSVQLGTLVKLVRVLMLGPVIFMLGIISGRTNAAEKSLSLRQMVPWFIIGFLGMIALRNMNLLPEVILPQMKTASTGLTILSMAALGLGVNLRTLMHASGRVIAVASLSILALAGASLGLIQLLHIQ